MQRAAGDLMWKTVLQQVAARKAQRGGKGREDGDDDVDDGLPGFFL